MKIEPFQVVRTSATSCPAAVGQRTFFYLRRHDPANPSFSLVTQVLLAGPLDHRRLETSIRELTQRHSVFRTRLEEVERGVVRQYVIPCERAPAVALPVTDLSTLAPDEQKIAQHAIVEQLRVGHDLDAGSVLRCHAIVLGADRIVLALSIHHAAGDGAAVRLFFDELARLYVGSAGDDDPLCFIDFADSLARWTQSPGGQAERAYWRDRLADAPRLELPHDHPREAVDARRDAVPFGLVGEPMSQLTESYSESERSGAARIASELGMHASAVYLAGVAHVLHGLTGQSDLCIEAAHNQRMGRRGLECIHGTFGTGRVMRIDASGSPSWPELARRTKEVVYDAYRRSWVPITDLAPHWIRRVLFNYLPQNMKQEYEFAPNVRATPIATPFSAQWNRHWDLQFLVRDTFRKIDLFYNTKLFERTTARMILDRFIELIRSSA